MRTAVIVDGDTVFFMPFFGLRIITIPMTTIRGSGHACIKEKKVCVKGDEKKVRLITPYTSGQYTVPGTAVVTIEKLKSDQIASDCLSLKALITEGKGLFDAKLSVLVPATTPPPASTPDNMMSSGGKGFFRASEEWVVAG